MKDLGYHKGYKYAHDFAGNFVEQQYLPDKLTNTRLWQPQNNSAAEIKLAEHLRKLWGGRY
jgi:putative ATPase